MSREIPIPTIGDAERGQLGESAIAATLRAVVDEREQRQVERIAAQINALREPVEPREVVTPKVAAREHRLASPMEPLYRRAGEIGESLGLVVLHQMPSALQVTGIVLVVLAGVAAQRGG